MLEISGLSIRAGDFRLRDVSFTLSENDHVVIVGASGAGKSLLLRAIAGLHAVDSGQIVRNGFDVTHEPTYRRRLPLIHQQPVLFGDRTVRANLQFPLRYRNGGNGTLEDIAERLDCASLLDRKPGSLSGGEQQRVALGRGLLTGAETLLLDEPLSALDVAARGELRSLLQDLRGHGISFLHVTHDYQEALALASHIGVIENGTLLQFGSREEILSDPRSPFVAQFAGIRNVIAGELLPSAPGRVREFSTGRFSASILTDEEPGSGFLLLRAEDVTLARQVVDDSARNHFRGTVENVLPAALGKEVAVDVGVTLTAHISHEAAEALAPKPGDTLYAGFKATAAGFIRSQS